MRVTTLISGPIIGPALVVMALITACGGSPPGTPDIGGQPSSPDESADAGYREGPVVGGGVVAGTVVFSGQPPVIETRMVTKNQDICGRGAKPIEELLLREGGAVENVVVSVEGIREGKPIERRQPVLDQVKCDYTPHVQSVNVGSTLQILNSDDTLHNVHGKLGGKATVFNLAMPLKDQKIEKLLTQPGVIHLQCDAGHTWMKAYVAVFPHPYHTTTSHTGSFRISDIPPGTYTLKAWHEVLGTSEQEITVTSGSEASVRVEFR